MCGLTFKSAQTYTPGSEKSGKFGQFPSSPGSPPMRTQCENDGVGPSSTNSWCHPGGATAAFGGAGLSAVDLALQAGLVASKSEANRLIKQGGLYVNDRRVPEDAVQVTAADLIGGEVLVLRKGQRDRRVIRAAQHAG